ncbi:class I SAM-dependent methyltransferase [Paenibacillus aurantius]|uniref:Class I SAM-dependent methyltransferase n=1 Tax=Paenibacillus aurantius TaxID=2918900 RepID=A0AA96RHB9_9BACL|nr:class I SAM-dependent methyltransferase [Paenibacillus aurantius]WNQ13198.1 class I SAM-dependent methyltransferase [Paenibacillus aurantius]
MERELDLEPELLAVLKSKMQLENMANLEVVEASMTDIPLKDNSIDIVIASLALHAVRPLSLSLAEIKRVLKPGGSILILEWEHKESPIGPPVEIRIGSEEMEQALQASGFIIEKRVFPTDYLYIFVARR